MGLDEKIASLIKINHNVSIHNISIQFAVVLKLELYLKQYTIVSLHLYTIKWDLNVPLMRITCIYT